MGMKIGMNIGWDMADGWRVLVLGSRTRNARNCARSAPECTYSQFMVARIEGLQ